MNQLIVSTRNRGKLKEIGEMLPGYQLLTLDDIQFTGQIPEPYHTFRENAYTKAKTVFDNSGSAVIADDSGLCINALNGAPGVISAHYAGFPPDDAANRHKVLSELAEAKDRIAYFISVICLVTAEGVHYFEGRCDGHIAYDERGTKGFGYDPIFIPDGYDVTFGELEPAVKNALSHRGKAVQLLVRFLGS